jgi:hypothetical protein
MVEQPGFLSLAINPHNDPIQSDKHACWIDDIECYKKWSLSGSCRNVSLHVVHSGSYTNNIYPLRQLNFLQSDTFLRRNSAAPREHGLSSDSVSLFPKNLQSLVGVPNTSETGNYKQTRKNDVQLIPPTLSRHGSSFGDRYGLICICMAYLVSGILIWCAVADFDRRRSHFRGWLFIAASLALNLASSCSVIIGCLPWNWWRCLHDGQDHSQNDHLHGINVTQKYLTANVYCNTFIIVEKSSSTANSLRMNKQIAIISAPAESSTIRSIEHMKDIHHDPLMRLDVKVGNGCARLLDTLKCTIWNVTHGHLQTDRIAIKQQ